MKKSTLTIYMVLAMVLATGNAIAQNGTCLTPVSYNAVLGSDGTVTINPEDVVNIGSDCSFETLTVTPEVFSCEDIGTHTVTVTGTTASQPTGEYTILDGLLNGVQNSTMVEGDVDGDGDIDIVVTNTFYKNNGDGTYFYAQGLGNMHDCLGPQLGDLDGDGDLDLVTARRVFHWNGTNFQYIQSFGENNAVYAGATLADFDGDGDLDYYAPTYYGEKDRIYFNDGNGNFSLAKEYTQAWRINATSGDFDNDGDIDVITVGYYNVYFGENDGNANLTYTSIYSNGNSYIMDVHAADFNNDGNLDLVWTAYDNKLLLGNGDGTFQTPQDIGAYYWMCDVEDFEGDGDIDILLHSRISSSYLMKNDGSANFTSEDTGLPGGFADAIMADFNIDGVMDFGFTRWGPGFIAISEVSSGSTSTTTSEVTVSDPNGVCNAPPVAIAQDVTASTSENCGAVVTIAEIDNGSYDPDGDELTYSVTPEGPYPLGITSVTLTVSDDEYSSSATAIITVVDDVAPVIQTASNTITLWPPNHKYESIDVADCIVSVSDNCSSVSVADVVITKVTSDEEEDANGGGDGHTQNDILIASDCKSVDLRKERKGNGNGRVYTIHMHVEDASGNLATATYQVHVPKNNNGTAVDDGAVYEVNSNCSDNKSAIAFDDADDAGLELKAYPNPARNMATVEVSVDYSMQTLVEIYNTFGQKVETLYDGMMESGFTNKLEFDASELSNGIYFIRLQGKDKKLITKKLIIRK